MKIKIKGQEYDASVDELGQFHARVGQEVYSADSLADLERKAKTATRVLAAKIAVPFTRASPDGQLRHGVATGLHGRTGSVLVRWDDGEAGQLASWYGDKQLARLDDAEGAEYTALLRALATARDAVTGFQAAHAINLQTAVKAAVDKALASGGES